MVGFLLVPLQHHPPKRVLPPKNDEPPILISFQYALSESAHHILYRSLDESVGVRSVSARSSRPFRTLMVWAPALVECRSLGVLMFGFRQGRFGYSFNR